MGFPTGQINVRLGEDERRGNERQRRNVRGCLLLLWTGGSDYISASHIA